LIYTIHAQIACLSIREGLAPFTDSALLGKRVALYEAAKERHPEMMKQCLQVISQGAGTLPLAQTD